jgi:hypothetical protein
MRRITRVLLLLAFTGVIVLPVAITFNNPFSNDGRVADGNGPIPPWPPCAFGSSGSALPV